jgi:hypothetical protein
MRSAKTSLDIGVASSGTVAAKPGILSAEPPKIATAVENRRASCPMFFGSV